jgi:hypothetical protein
MERELEQLKLEAGIEPADDPAPPSGDLKSDIAAFTTLDACVRARTAMDPLLGDAIDALGYGGIVRDACRILLALKDKNIEACRPIVASGLRAKCESYVAIALGNPSLCPINGSGKFAARDTICLARASRDERMCAAASPGERARCRALVLGRRSECGADESCARQVDRYKSLLEKPEEGPPLPGHLHVDVSDEKGAPVNSFDLDAVAAAGAVLRVMPLGMRISLGTPKTAAWPAPDGPLTTPRLFLEVTMPSTEQKPAISLGPRDVDLDLLVPKVGLLSAVLANDTKLEVRHFSAEPKSPIEFVLSMTLHDAPRTFRVKFDVQSFVREKSGPTDRTP